MQPSKHDESRIGKTENEPWVISLRFVWILSYHVELGIWAVLFVWIFVTKMSCPFSRPRLCSPLNTTPIRSCHHANTARCCVQRPLLLQPVSHLCIGLLYLILYHRYVCPCGGGVTPCILNLGTRCEWSASTPVPASYGTQKFIAVFTRARHSSLTWAKWIQSTHHPISLRILFFHLLVGLPSCLFSSIFPTKTLYSLLFHACYMPLLSYPPWFD
jgi:hypothetical protein